MNHPTYDIVIDFDDVIYPFVDGVEEVLASEGIPGKVTQWAMHHDFGLSYTELWDIILDPKHRDAIYYRRISASTLASLRRLRYAGHRVHLVTARMNPVSELACYEVLSRDRITFDSVTFTDHKADVATEVGAAFSLDDKPAHYLSFEELDNHFAILMDAPHNQMFTHTNQGLVRRVRSVSEFADYIATMSSAGVQLRGEIAA